MPTQRDIRAKRAIDVVDGAYRLEGTEAEWLDALLGRARPDLDTGCGVYAFTGNDNIPNLDASPVFVQQDLDAAYAERLAEVNREAPRAIYDLVRTRLVTVGGLVQTLGVESPVVRHFLEVMKPTGVKDGFSMFAQDAAGSSISLSAPARRQLSLAPRTRGIWRRVGLHIASALRLRRRLAADRIARDALLDPSGKLEDAVDAIRDDKAATNALKRAVQAIEHARRPDVRTSPERALTLWQGLVAGEWSLVDHWERGGRRYIAAYRNRPELRDPRALTSTERAMLKYLALGATNEDIMYALGLRKGTVSSAVSQILKKLRMRRRVELAVFADPSRMVRRDLVLEEDEVGVLEVEARPRGAATASLSRAELEVAAYVIRGFPNERIARERQVSTRTIANQLRSIFEKVGVDNRSQLASALTSDGLSSEA
jgi:DNA-binding NarL/FixJ family response regulator